MVISTALIKDLRESTGAGMLDCKNALAETGGDIEKAKDLLRAKGIAKAAKKASRVAAEGLVAVLAESKKAIVIELNSETDFVARNDQFQNLANGIAKAGIATDGSLEAVLAAPFPGASRSIDDEIKEAVGVIGENLNLRRTSLLSVNDGVISTYMHNAVTPSLGKIGVLVALESKADTSKLNELGRKIGMHIAAARPDALHIEDVSADALEREKAIFVEQAKSSGKPDNVVEKMVEGRIRKYYEEVVLLEQAFVIDGKTKIKDVIAEAAKELGAAITLKAFARFALGEGVEKEESNFAEEVAAAARG